MRLAPSSPLIDIGEVVEGPGVRAGAEEAELDIRERGIDLTPARDLGVGLPDRPQLVDGKAGRPVVLDVDDVRQRVGRDPQLDVFDPGVRAQSLLLLVDRPRRIGEVGLARAEALEPAAGARDPDSHVDVLLRLEVLCGLRDERPDRARAVCGDRSAAPLTATARAEEDDRERGCCDGGKTPHGHGISLPARLLRPGRRPGEHAVKVR